MTDRAAFEAWYLDNFTSSPANMPINARGEYRRPQQQITYMAWTAAIAHERAACAAIVKTEEDQHAKRGHSYEGYAVAAVGRAIRSRNQTGGET